MVRVNIIDPKKLADQHLIAEYNEILMLLGYVKKNPELDLNEIPESYRLGKGHIKFFKNKLRYLEKRHDLIKKEMIQRGFKAERKFDLSGINKNLVNDWEPKKEDLKIIKERIKYKLNLKPNFYRYYRENKGRDFLIGLLNK